MWGGASASGLTGPSCPPPRPPPPAPNTVKLLQRCWGLLQPMPVTSEDVRNRVAASGGGRVAAERPFPLVLTDLSTPRSIPPQVLRPCPAENSHPGCPPS